VASQQKTWNFVDYEKIKEFGGIAFPLLFLFKIFAYLFINFDYFPLKL